MARSHTTEKEEVPNLVGETVDNGKLFLLSKLGSGAYGVVYRAVDVTSPDGEEFAVKHSRRPILPRISDIPGVVTMHRHFENDKFLFLVFYYARGGDLFGAITKTNIYYRNDDLVKSAIIQLIDATEACHKRNVFHRDLKPENILCEKDSDRLYLADFGLASGLTISSQFGCGSSFYMSPECIGKEFSVGAFSTRHNDIWSLAVILVNIVTGRNPWRIAMKQDDCFSGFMRNPDYLLTMLPISREFNDLLCQIFLLNPLDRLSLPEFRREVRRMPTFFMAEKDLSRASHFVRSAAQQYGTQGLPRVPRIAIDPTLLNDESQICSSCSSSSLEFAEADIGSAADLDLEEGYAFDRPNPYSPAFVPQRQFLTPPPRDAFVIASLSGTTATSDADSGGPITPETRAVRPVVQVPSLPDDMGLGEGLVVPTKAQATSGDKAYLYVTLAS
ncbi:hypothetical protein EWM64_g73 [Hericium alpestre]|uniref:Protein kinase domain-containing protein n=1 Tax=Hericium alpestre TaxID=135208 RepID=A0A4Z0ADB5_9AGAM|nr:hypothetical protein EWM64_g73 [Hericium alpestre]